MEARILSLALVSGLWLVTCSSDPVHPARGGSPPPREQHDGFSSREMNLLVARIHEGLFELSQRHSWLADYQDYDFNRKGQRWGISYARRKYIAREIWHPSRLTLGYVPLDHNGCLPGHVCTRSGHRNAFGHLDACRFPALGAKLTADAVLWEEELLWADVQTLVLLECKKTQFSLRSIF